MLLIILWNFSDLNSPAKVVQVQVCLRVAGVVWEIANGGKLFWSLTWSFGAMRPLLLRAGHGVCFCWPDNLQVLTLACRLGCGYFCVTVLLHALHELLEKHEAVSWEIGSPPAAGHNHTVIITVGLIHIRLKKNKLLSFNHKILDIMILRYEKNHKLSQISSHYQGFIDTDIVLRQ